MKEINIYIHYLLEVECQLLTSIDYCKWTFEKTRMSQRSDKVNVIQMKVSIWDEIFSYIHYSVAALLTTLYFHKKDSWYSVLSVKKFYLI